MFVAQVSVVGWGRNVAGSSRRKHVAIERLDKHRRQCVFTGDLFLWVLTGGPPLARWSEALGGTPYISVQRFTCPD